MSRSNYRRFNDSQLRVLLCIAVNKPISQDAVNFLQPIVPPGWKPRDYDRLTQTDLTVLTDIEKGNLSNNIKELVAGGYLMRQGSKGSKRSGRPGEYLDLASTYVILDLRDELEYRMSVYEEERIKLQRFVDTKWNDMLSFDPDAGEAESDEFDRGLEEYSEAQARLGKLYPWSVSTSLKEVSYPMVNHWLWRMRQEAENVPVVKGIVCNSQFDGPFD